MVIGNMLTGFIYKIINTKNNKIYIGQTRKTVLYRFKSHIRAALKDGSASFNTKLSRAIRKYGKEIFVVETLNEIIFPNKELLCKELNRLEKFYIAKYNSVDSNYGYNIQKGGLVSSKEAILKLEQKLLCYTTMYNEYEYKTANEIIIKDHFAEIILYNSDNNEKIRTVIDKDDIPKVSSYRWSLLKPKRGIYAYSSNNDIRLEHLIINCPKDHIIIHLNNNGLDNRKCNLKIVSRQEKLQNTKRSKNNVSGYKGVWFCKDRNKWQALITINYKTKSLGRFLTLEEAVAARLAAEKQYYKKW